MRAIVVARPGGYAQLCVVEKTLPDLAPNEVRAAVSYIGVNYADCLVRMGLYAAAKKSFPIVPGFDFSGVVTKVGSEVSKLKPGDRVLGVTRFGAYQTEVQVSQAQVLKIPDTLTLAVAASLPTAYLTASYLLRELAHLSAGERLLVRSVGGGVGSWLYQLGVLIGAEVHGTVSTAEKKKILTGRGISHVSVGVPEGQFDVIANAQGGASIGQDLARLKLQGRLLLYGFHGFIHTNAAGRLSILSYIRLAFGLLRMPRIHPFELVSGNKAVLGCNLVYLFDDVEENRASLQKLFTLIGDGKVDVPPITEIPFEEVAKAQQLLEHGKTIGKLVLKVTQP